MPQKRLALIGDAGGDEIHAGETQGADWANGTAASPDGRVFGTYLHGLFGADAQRAAWLAKFGAASQIENHDALIEQTLDALAAHLEAHIDIDRLLTLAR